MNREAWIRGNIVNIKALEEKNVQASDKLTHEMIVIPSYDKVGEKSEQMKCSRKF